MFWVDRWTAGTQTALTNPGGIPNARDIQITWARFYEHLANGNFKGQLPDMCE